MPTPKKLRSRVVWSHRDWVVPVSHLERADRRGRSRRDPVALVRPALTVGLDVSSLSEGPACLSDLVQSDHQIEVTRRARPRLRKIDVGGVSSLNRDGVDAHRPQHLQGLVKLVAQEPGTFPAVVKMQAEKVLHLGPRRQPSYLDPVAEERTHSGREGGHSHLPGVGCEGKCEDWRRAVRQDMGSHPLDLPQRRPPLANRHVRP